MSDRPVALITGASMGIGEAFAEALALRGYDLALVARSGPALQTIAERIGPGARVRVESIVADLEDLRLVARAFERSAVFQVGDEAQALLGRVDLLINNAGFGAHGPFETIDPQRNLGQVRLNVEALVALTNRFAPAMLERGTGGIINVASTAAFQPVPYMAVYGATKAFVLSFSEALAEEFRGRGVRVLALCPGATRTNFFSVAGEGAQVGRFRTSAQVVQTALRAYDRGAAYVIDGAANRVMAFSPRLAPRALVARIGGRLMKPAAV
jgi:short-subunit dehydrogenase